MDGVMILCRFVTDKTNKSLAGSLKIDQRSVAARLGSDLKDYDVVYPLRHTAK
jgi:FixJ family two-component response regulator